MRIPSLCFPLVAAITLILAPLGSAQEKPAFLFDAGETTWKGERLQLPTGFAPDMKWKGEEDIRFAPGMFDANADDFFTYVLVFLLNQGEDDSAKAIQREILTYYRGLSKAVSKGAVTEADAEKFSVEMKKEAEVVSAPAGIDPKSVTAYSGTLDWIEPFATKQAQTLHFEAHAWKHGERPAMFLCVSPKKRDAAIWENLRKIRSKFRIED